MQAYPLTPHPARPPSRVSAVEVRVTSNDPHWLSLRWRIEDAGGLVLPGITGKVRADGLWQTTCFELFLCPEGSTGYHEWNLSPSREWNAYSFTSYREGMAPIDVARAPECVIRQGSKFTLFDASIPRAALPRLRCSMGLSAVIEEAGGIKSYWALAHPVGENPDFHDAACFAATLDPPKPA